jgi:hypothetical protein
MKKFLLLLVFPFLATTASYAQGPGKRTRVKAKHHYEHASESSRGKSSKARFRPVNNIRPTIDLNPRSLERFKTTRAAKSWKWTKGV